MESGNGGTSSKGVLVPVSEQCDVFQSSILAPLKNAYLYEESKQSFRYKSAVLVQNPALEEKYNAFREKRREVGYSEEDLKESYGFLLFEDTNQANALSEIGVLPGNSTCTTLGDPSKGVYISMYSDCLDLNRWYHGKSGYVAIIRLTKGRVKRVLENYTQNFTAPTVGFDCHVSEQLPSVSSKTSSFLAFERTQYYMYELLDDGRNVTTQSPSAACPIAIVSFSYTDTKATLEASQEKSEEKKIVCQYFPWRGQLQIGPQVYEVGLRSTAGALIPAVLPPIVEIRRVISMLNLRQLLPRAVFETCFYGEVFLDGLYFSLCELVSSEVEETHSLSLLLREIKEKDLALTIQLNDGGFLILLHSSHFLKYDDTGSSATDVLQGMFVFPNSQVIQRDTKFRERKFAMSSEIRQVLPVLSYAEAEVEKTPFDPSEEFCEVLAQHMQTYAALINPGLASSPTREVSIFPDQYDVPDAHKHLYSSPEWTNKAWQSFRSYLNKPDSFQLPVSKASEILAAGQEERMEDLDDDVYICLSSPEEQPDKSVSMESEDQLTVQISPVNSETPVDSCITNTESQVDFITVPQNVVPDDVQVGDTSKDTAKSELSVLNKTDDMGAKNLLTPSTSDDLPAELIVSITSAEQTITNEGLSMISTVSATKQNYFQLSVFSTAKLQTEEVNCRKEVNVAPKKFLDCPGFTKNKRRGRRGHYKSRKKVSKACVETPSLQIPVEDDNLKSRKEFRAKGSSGHPKFSPPSNVDRRKVQMRMCKFRQLSINEKVNSASIGLAVPDEKKTDPGQQSLESTISMDIEAYPLRKKTERWDLKPVISECGRILVPHGSVDFADQIKFLKDKLQSTKDEQCLEKMLIDTFVNDSDEIVQESDPTQETAVGKTEATTSKDGGNHLQRVVNNVIPGHSILVPSDDGKGSLILNSESSEHFSRTDGTATPPSEAVKEKHTDTLSPGKIAKKGEFLLSKLKSVLLRGKRKTDLLVSEETTADTAQDTEPCLKKGKVDLQARNLKSNYTITSVQDTNVCVKEVSKMLSVDPIFAYALGLTPRETVDKIPKTDGRDIQQEQTVLDKQLQIIHRPPPIFPRRGRIKTLKKHQGISTEYVKQKWWLHFQTPTCIASEKHKFKECTRANSVRKTVKKKINSACSSTDALSLLADLALSANNDQVPPQPDPALERKTETSLKKCDLSKDHTSAEQESVLHSLLRQPAARPMRPLESTSPNHLVEVSEWVGLVSKEHAYSLPPSSSLLLGLPGTPFQVSPLSGSTRLLRHHHTMYGNEIKTLPPSVGKEDSSEQNHRTPEYLKKHLVRRRKFRHSRTFVNKDGSIQVTKQWKENYDFDLDSKFSNDSKDRTIVRALHGPWDFSMQDTSEEVRLIVHMWIGLFYSRSTSRFFNLDSSPFSEESDSLSIEMASAQAPFELKANSFAPFPSITDTSISKILDFSKKEDSMLDQGSGILDLSLRNTNAEIVSPDPQAKRKETFASIDRKEASEILNALKSSVGPQEANAIQHTRHYHKASPLDDISQGESSFYPGPERCAQLCIVGAILPQPLPPKHSKKMVHSTEIINEVNDVRRAYENKRTCTPLEKAGSLEHTDVSSCKGDETIISVQEEMEKVSVQPENNETASGISYVLHGYNNKKTDMKDGIENSEATEMSLVQKHEKDSAKSVTDEEVDSNREAGDVLHTVEHDETESKDGENLEVKEKDGRLEHTDVPSCKEDETIISVREEMEKVSVQQENNQMASGISHVLHGYNNKKTDMKDGIENSEATEMSLVQTNEKDSSKSVTDEEVDSNREVGDVLHTVEHAETESKDGENWDVKEKAGSLEHTDVPSCKGDETIICVREEMEKVSVQQENNQTASGISHVLHGYNNKKMDTKDGIENSEATEMSLVQKHEKDSSKSVTDEEVDSNREVGDVLHTVEHAETESKDGENWDVKEKAGSLEHTDVPSCKGDETIICVREEMEKVSVQQENNQTASGISHVLHGYNNKKMDTKDGIENSEATEISLVQKHEKHSSKSVTDKEVDSNRETVDVLHTVEHDETESKDGENWEVKQKPYQEGNVKQSPEVIHANEDPTNEELGVVCNGNVLENENQLPTEELKAVSPDKTENVNDDVEVMKAEDHIGKEDRLCEKDSCVSPVQTDRDLSEQPVPMMFDGPDSVKMDCITESNPEPPLDEQPPQADNKEGACNALQLRNLCANGSANDHAISEKCTHAPSKMNPFSEEPAVENRLEKDIYLADKVHYQKLELPMSDDNKCKDGPIPQTNDKVMPNFNWSGDDDEDLDTKSIKGEQEADNTTEKNVFHHQAHSPQCEAEEELTKETDLKQIDKTNEALEKIHSMVVIPFIGIDTSGEDTVQPHDSHSQSKVEEVVQDQDEIPFISETTSHETDLPTGVCSESKMDAQKAELSVGKILLSVIDVSNTNHPGTESDDQCATPTMDEKPYVYLTCSASPLTQKRLSRGSTSMKDEMSHRSTVNCDANPHHNLHPDLELRTLRVLQSIDKFLSKSSHSDTSSQIETADMKRTLDETAKPRSKNITSCFSPSHTSFNSNDKIMSNTAPAVVSASTSQEINTESADPFPLSPFKSKLEEVLGVKLLLLKTESSVQDYFERTDTIQETSPGQEYGQPYISGPSTESMQAINLNVDQDIHTTTSQKHLNQQPRSYSQRPVMAVKPCQSDENQGISIDRQIENAVMSHFSKDKQTETPKVTYTIPTTMLLVKNTESPKRTSEGVNEVKQEASELSTKSSWLSNVSDSKSQDISKLNKIPSSLPGQSFKSANGSYKFNDGNQGSVEKVGQTIKKSIQMIQKDCSDASTSHADKHDGAIIDDSLFLGPQSSLICTVYNTTRKRSHSFLEQVSQRCIQDDLTEASMEQECLIFSEKMKHLLKRSKRGPLSQLDMHDKLNLSCASPVTVHFCSLEEQEDSVDQLNTHLNTRSLVGQKIKVHMPERKDLTEKEKTLRLQNISPGTGNPMEHAGVSGVTSECASMYRAMMTDVCAVKKVPSRPQHFRMDRGYPKTEPGNHFDFYDQMKKELDKSFRSNLNSVVKKSCKTKYRFYILVTSDDAFFEETKAQLEAEGHTAVQPFQFFLAEESSSSLLIILRNEDIAEHICEVPHLLKLKTSPGVQFAGIDEPDDVVNLTHQELFTRGGFIMFDRAALEPLSLCTMKKMSEILQEFSGTGKWKWMMHYGDSRRLKENARLSVEAKEKKHFLNFCLEAGLLEVLPYHECDLMSRDLPDYLTCLVRLQVQNISARYPVFITDATTDSAFGKNGILTMTLQSFLTYSPSETFTV
ncbi:uncharacterized protein tasor2 isoform X2 [Cyclopterus lumpus]|uniref:uncharacterized protein tasor2 isoform X2 n=1 Tax=Cyclopterus lumpus TaxID=8103 RepID=UPI001485D21D|nr:uncharacterized protein tasor2 isoform X2 [Cyclopterus lumpus]